MLYNKYESLKIPVFAGTLVKQLNAKIPTHPDYNCIFMPLNYFA